jgi:hypothetical protein
MDRDERPTCSPNAVPWGKFPRISLNSIKIQAPLNVTKMTGILHKGKCTFMMRSEFLLELKMF